MADVSISVGLTTKEVEDGLKELNKEIRSIDKLYRELGKGDNFAEQLETAGKKAELLTKKMQLQQRQIDDCEKELKEYKRQLEGLDEGSDEFEKMSQNIVDAEKKLNKLTNEFKLTNAQLGTTEKNMGELGAKVKETTGKFDGLKDVLKSINFQSLGMAITNMGYAMQNLGSRIVSSFVGALDESKEFTAELETQQFLLNQLPKGVQDVIDKLGDKSFELGFTEFQTEQVATKLASFFEQNKLTDSVDLTEVMSRAMDLSAMWDLDINEVIERIKKMMLGNFENSDALGFNMNVKSIEEFLGVDWQKLSYAEQMMASLEYIMAKTEATTGRAKEEADGFASQWNLMKQNISETKNTLLSYMQEAILPYIEKINEMVTPIKNWINNHQELSAKIGLVVVALGGLLAIVGTLAIPLGSLVQIFGVLAQSEKVALLFTQIKGALSVIAGPIGLVVAGIAALVAGLVYAYNESEKFREVVDKAWNAIKTAVQTAIDFVKPYIETFLQWLPSAWNSATNFLGDVWIGLIEGLVDMLPKVKEYFVGFWDTHGEAITSVFTRIWSGVVQTFNDLKTGAENVFNALKAFWAEWGDEITSFFSTVWENMKVAFEFAWNSIATVIDVAVTLITGILQAFFQLIDGDFSGAWNTFKETIVIVWNEIKEYISLALSNIWEVIQNTFTWIKDNAPIIWGAFVDFIKTKSEELGTFIIEKFQEIAPKVAEFIQDLPSKIYDWLCEVLPKIAEWGSNVISKFGEALSGVGDNVGNYFTGTLIPKFKEWLDGIIDKVIEWKDNMVNKVKEMVEAVKEWFDQLPYNIGFAIGTALKAIIDWGTNMVAKAKEIGTNFVNGIINFFQQLPTKIANFINQVWTNVSTWAVNMVNKARELGTNFVNGVISFFQQLPTKIATLISNVLTTINRWATNMISKAREVGTNFVNGVVSFIQQLPSKIQTFISNVLTKINSFKTQMTSRAREAGQSFLSTLISKLSEIPSRVLSIGTRIVQSLWNGISNMTGWLRSKFSGFVNGLVAGITGGKDGFITVAQAFETDAMTGLPATVFSYGKDDFDVRTISLADFSSPYLSGKSSESQMFTNAFSTASTYNYVNSQSITNNRSTVKQLGEEEKDKEINITINIDQMNGTEQDVSKLMKQIDHYMRTHGKRW